MANTTGGATLSIIRSATSFRNKHWSDLLKIKINIEQDFITKEAKECVEFLHNIVPVCCVCFISATVCVDIMK